MAVSVEMSLDRRVPPSEHAGIPEAVASGTAPQSPAPPTFCALVAKVLACHRCWIRLTGADGEVVVEDHFDGWPQSTAPSGRIDGISAPTASAVFPSDAVAAQAFLWQPVVLPDGISGVVGAADRIDGRPFGESDRETLDHLVRFYVTTYDGTAWQEVRRLRAELKEARRQATQVAEQERGRLSRELHDDIGHAITTAILGLDIKSQAFQAGSQGHKAMVAAREVLVDCADHVHAFAFYLRPRVLTDLGLVAAVRGLARRVRETGAIAVELSVEGRECRLHEETELAAFRVVQEAVTNALKHARATLIRISVAYTDAGLEIKIRDDGDGFAPDAAASGAALDRDLSGQGLAGMRARAQLVGGVLEIESQRGAGTAIWARLPFMENET